MQQVDTQRVFVMNDAPVLKDRSIVLYWMIANRRVHSNYALERAIEWCHRLNRPLIVFEGVRLNYPWASDRIHQFIVQGMRDNARHCRENGVTYFGYVEPSRDLGKGLLAALAVDAAVVVTDHFPTFFLPAMVRSAGATLPCRLEAVDSNGLLPLATPGKAFDTAYQFRRMLHKTLPDYLRAWPSRDPLAGGAVVKGASLPEDSLSRWPQASLDSISSQIRDLPLDHSVAPVEGLVGGRREALIRLKRFVDQRLSGYERRNQPDEPVTSELAPYLHFGHISAHEVVREVLDSQGWNQGRLSDKPNGRRTGWWGVDLACEGFLDQVITWRELGYGFAHHRRDHGEFSSLPAWALETLDVHRHDPRPYLYTPEEFRLGETHDELWNACQNQLRMEGKIHNYLRMLWGKKILHWSRSAQDALMVMTELNNRYALDGRDPNSVSGIFWVLGRHDRPWGPERPVFGKVRYMTSDNTARKLDVRAYVQRYGS